jgi:YD repeat-containing protein
MEKPRTNYNTWTSINSLSGFEQVTSISYNSVGRPRGVTEFGQDQTIYIWGYGNEYPIAVIKGASQDAVISKLGGQSAVNNLENALVPTMDAEALFSILSEIQGALVTTYEFKPLIGVTKTIMPNGMINTYEYDALGRLTKIHDHHGTVSQQFQYNYKRR